MSWEIVPLVDGLGRWCGDWDNLNKRLYGGHPFGDSRFVDVILRHFGGQSERLCLHRTAGRIDAMLILYPRRKGIWAQFVPAQAQSAPPLVENKALFRELFSILPRGTWAIELLCQDPFYIPDGLLVEDATTRLSTHAFTMNVEIRSSFDEYWEGRPKKLIQNMRRYQRRITEALGTPHMRVLREPQAMHDAVLRYGQLESAGWKGRLGTAVSGDNVQGHFYSEIMRLFAESGQGQAVEYWLNDRLVASRLLIIGGGMIVMLKTAYDENVSKYAPGRLLLKDYLEYAFSQNGVRMVEFYTDATADQLAWSTGRRHIFHVMLFRGVHHARLYNLFQSLKRRGEADHQRDEETDADPTLLSSAEVEFCGSDAGPSEDCSKLFAAASKNSFDLSEAWFRLMGNSALQADARVEYAIIRRHGGVLGVMPMLIQPPGRWVRQGGSLSNFYTSIYRPILSLSSVPDADDLAAAVRGIVARERLDILRFDAMDLDHPSFSLLESALRRAGLKPYRFFCFGNWFLPVEGRSFDDYFQGLPSRVRNTVRRGERRFFADGRGRLELIAGDGLDQAIAAWSRVYEASWKIPEPFPEFVPGLIRLCAERGWLRLGIAYYDGEPVAAQLWIVSHGRAVIYKLAHDEKVAKLSVGTVLTAFLMAHVLDVDKVREVDYLIGDDAYKKDWMSHRRERWGIVAYNPRSVAGLVGLAIQVLGNLRRSLRGGAEGSVQIQASGVAEGPEHVGHG